MILFFAVFLLWPSLSMAALSCTTGGEWNDANPTIATETISVTTPALANKILVFPSYRRGGGSGAITITHAGNALSDATTQNYLDPMGGAFMYRDNPTSGTNNVVVTYATTGLARGGVILFCTDVDNAAGFRSTNQATGNNTTPAVTAASANSGDLVVGCVASEVGGSDVTVGGGETQIEFGNNAEMNYSCSTKPGSSGGAISDTVGSTQQWVAHVLVLKSAVATTNFLPYRRRE